MEMPERSAVHFYKKKYGLRDVESTGIQGGGKNIETMGRKSGHTP
jgi:hypothetical protein